MYYKNQNEMLYHFISLIFFPHPICKLILLHYKLKGWRGEARECYIRFSHFILYLTQQTYRDGPIGAAESLWPPFPCGWHWVCEQENKLKKWEKIGEVKRNDLHLVDCQIIMLMMTITKERTTARMHIFLRDFCYSEGRKILPSYSMYATCMVLDSAILLHILTYI